MTRNAVSDAHEQIALRDLFRLSKTRNKIVYSFQFIFFSISGFLEIAYQSSMEVLLSFRDAQYQTFQQEKEKKKNKHYSRLWFLRKLRNFSAL